jgi:glyoxylase-like metal-dependent hydrolase (beta-lactamase superfamily II)
VPFRVVTPDDRLPLGLSVHRIGNPRRYEQPVLLPERRALAFGDAVVGADGGLRVWVQQELDARTQRWYHERLVPSLEPLLELDFDRVLVTHGDPVLSDGRAALAAALAAPPWQLGTS